MRMHKVSGMQIPVDIATEQVVIGALFDPENHPDIFENVLVEDFFSEDHRIIFEVGLDLFRKRAPVDVISANRELNARGKEGLASKIETARDDYVSAATIPYYIDRLKAFSKRRKLQVILDHALRQVQNPSIEYPELHTALSQEIIPILKDGNLGVQKIELPTFGELSRLDVKVEYLIEGLIPKQAITMIFGPGGIGKSYLCLQLGSCVADGKPFCGLPTIKSYTYYIDFENPWRELCRRAKVLDPSSTSSMPVWHLSNPVQPPRLDSKDWPVLKTLPPGLLIIDSLRASHLLDENSSKDMALIMGRLKELRELGFTLILIHHTPKLDSRIYKGSTAIIDLCDHALGLERVKAVGSDQTVEDDNEDLPFRLGVRQKTRFAPFKTFLMFNPDHGFSRADDPDGASLVDMKALLEEGFDLNQSEFYRKVKTELGFTKGVFRRLLRKGTGSFWTETKGARNTYFYRPVSVFQQENQTSKKAFQKGQETLSFEVGNNTELSSFPEVSEKTQKTARVELSSFPTPLGVRKTRKTGKELEHSDYDDSDLPEGAADFNFASGEPGEELPFEK
jgi:RecA/RadA recombinase